MLYREIMAVCSEIHTNIQIYSMFNFLVYFLLVWSWLRIGAGGGHLWVR